jgi:hypothetical protein
MKLLDEARQGLRLKRYSYRTEDCYDRWVEQLIPFHKGPDGFRIRRPSPSSSSTAKSFTWN